MSGRLRSTVVFQRRFSKVSRKSVKNADNSKPAVKEMTNLLTIDPTRLGLLRKPSEATVKRLYADFIKRVQQKLLEENVLGFGRDSYSVDTEGLELNPKTGDKDYSGGVSDSFREWLEQQAAELVNEEFVTDYVSKAYKRGRERAYSDGQRVKIKPKQAIHNAEDFQSGGKEQFMQIGEQSTQSKKTLKAMITGAVSQLKGIAQQMVQSVVRVISEGILRKKKPQDIVQDVKEETGKFQSRAEASVNDDLTRVHAESQLDAYSDLGHGRVTAVIETAGDNRVCPKCKMYEGRELPIEQARGLLPAHPHCFVRHDTQVFTNSGWKAISDVDIDVDLFLSENPETGETEFVKAVQKIEYDYNGEAIEFSGKRFQLTVTDEHSMYALVRKRNISDWSTYFKSGLFPANDIPKESKFPAGLRSWSSRSPEVKVIGQYTLPFTLYVRFMAAWLADGSISRKGQVKISQQDKQWLVHELTGFPIPFWNAGDIQFTSNDFGFLHEFGHCTEKYIPEDIKNAEVSDVKEFLRIYSKTDGSVVKGRVWKGYRFGDTVVFYTTSKRMISDLCWMILRAGGRPSVGINNNMGHTGIKKDGMIVKSNYPCYCITWCHQLYSLNETLCHRIFHHTGKVYCVELEKWHTLYAMEDGKCTWTGNCRCVWKPVQPKLFVDEKERDKRQQETLLQSVERLQQEEKKAAQEANDAAERAKTKPNDTRVQATAEKAEYERLKRHAAMLGRYGDAIRVLVLRIRDKAAGLLASWEKHQKKQEKGLIENAKRVRRADFTIDAERIIARVKDILTDLPDSDAVVKQAEAAYNSAVNAYLNEHKKDDSVPEDLKVIRAWTAGMQKYIGYVWRFPALHTEVQKKADMLGQFAVEIERAIALADREIPKFQYEVLGRKELNEKLVDTMWGKLDKPQRESIKAYSGYEIYTAMNSMMRKVKFEKLQEIYDRLKRRETTLEDEKLMSQYAAFDKRDEDRPLEKKRIIMVWQDVLRNCVQLQSTAGVYKTDKKYCFRRYVRDFRYFGAPKIGGDITLNGFTSTFSTLAAATDVDDEEQSVEPNFELWIPEGIPIIPIGNKAVKKTADEIVLPHGIRAKVIFICEIENPYLIAEVLPPDKGFDNFTR